MQAARRAATRPDKAEDLDWVCHWLQRASVGDLSFIGSEGVFTKFEASKDATDAEYHAPEVDAVDAVVDPADADAEIPDGFSFVPVSSVPFCNTEKVSSRNGVTTWKKDERLKPFLGAKLPRKSAPPPTLVMYRFTNDVAGEPRGWFQGELKRQPKKPWAGLCSAATEVEEDLNFNIKYKNSFTNGEIDGVIATKLDMSEYGPSPPAKWVLVEKTAT